MSRGYRSLHNSPLRRRFVREPSSSYFLSAKRLQRNIQSNINTKHRLHYDQHIQLQTPVRLLLLVEEILRRQIGSQPPLLTFVVVDHP